ncbi:Glycosyltransferase [Melia azedarach]|uniref:Glycosyltransferase n=1 Tax=Melia azedarach TaxID=155640 RepID=A0ACC1XFA3_MELAZ|nr:Glycosyltransferase [Melia azedarach]
MPEGSSTQKHVAALAFPFGTHATPMLNLVRRLSSAVPDVKFSFLCTAHVNEALFSKKDELDVDKIKPVNVDSGLPEGFQFRGNPEEPVEYFLKATPGNFERALKTAVAEMGTEVSCLLTDAFLWFSAEIAESMRVPWIPYWTSGARSLLLHVDTDNIRQIMGVNVPENKTLDFLPGFSSIRAKDLPEGIISGDIEGPFPEMLHKLGKAMPKATVVVSNHIEELDLTVVETLKSRLRRFLNIGSFTSTTSQPDPHGCLQWLNQREKSSVVYISFSTVMAPPAAELTALAEGLEELGLPFLWSFRGNAEEQLPKGFVERTSAYGKLVPWTPQPEVLAHSSVGVFVTHSGWNSVTESIAGGVPMVCRPIFGDQTLNWRTVEAVWGIGLGVEGGKLTKDGTVTALKVVLSSEEGKRMREKVGVLKELTIKAVEADGSSTKDFKALVEVVTKS